MDEPNAPAGPSQSVQDQLALLAARKQTQQSHRGNTESLVPASKLAKNKRLPATMITPAGHIESSKKQKKHESGSVGLSSRKKKRSEKNKEKALEMMEKRECKIRQSEEKKAKRKRAKTAWE